MTKVIWKFPLETTDIQGIEMPMGADILSVQVQNKSICLWALCDPSAEKKKRYFLIFGTGNPVPDANQKFIGTVQMISGELVFHVFEIYSLK